MESNLIIIATKFAININGREEVYEVRPISIYTTMQVIKELERDHKNNYKKEMLEIASSLQGKEKVDFLTNALNNYVKVSGESLLTTEEGYKKILQTVLKLKEEQVEAILQDESNSKNITDILKCALDIKDTDEEKKI
jgi:rRNA-processing protein FCF1